MSTTEEKPTAAQQYQALKEKQFEQFLNDSFTDEKLKDVPLYEVKVPSGMIFKCRPVGVDYFRNSGALPMSFVSEAAIREGENTDDKDEKTFQKLSTDDKIAAIAATSQMVRYCAVEPRLIIGKVNGHRNAISTSQLSMGDYEALASFAKGGEKSAGLRTFRSRRK